MITTRHGQYDRRAPSNRSQTEALTTRPRVHEELGDEVYFHTHDHEEQILVHFNDQLDGTTHAAQEGEQWESEAPLVAHKASTRRSSKSYTSRVSRQKSRRRELLGRQVKPGITVDTSFTRHRGNAPHQVYPHDAERSSGSVRKSPWFGLGRSSTRNKGLGITKGTPQPHVVHRVKPSIDRNDLTAISLASGNKPWQDISPWDRRIPIGISVPTDSVSDFSSYQASRQRAGSDATLVTPSIIITPAAAMQSVWSPDTPFTESDYTPSIYSRHPFDSTQTDVPPVPAIPAGLSKSTEGPNEDRSVQATSGHSRNDTLDSAGTAFEEYDDSRRKDRIMSSGTVFEEDETPLRERTVQTSLAIDTSMVPTPRRSQGWWNVITTPFVTTPNTATWTQDGRNGQRTPDVPTVPSQYGTSSDAAMGSVNPTIKISTAASVNAVQHHTQHTDSLVEKDVQSYPSAEATVSMPAAQVTTSPPRQPNELPRQININIELQDRRPIAGGQTTIHQVHTSAPTPQPRNTGSPVAKPSTAPQSLPVFAPPPTSAHKASHFSYDNISRSSSPSSTPDLKGQKKHRKVCNMQSLIPFSKKRQQKRQDGSKEKKKKRGVCFWGCCCCLILLILLAILIPVVVVLIKKHNQSPAPTAPSQDIGDQWLNLPNYPPMPTGILTVAQPEAVEEESGCVAPTTLWSCALPKELQNAVKPNKPDQPNFKIEITFENGTSAELPKSQRVKRTFNPVSAGAFIRSRLLQGRAAPSASPAAPSVADLAFLGQTTDGNIAPFEGEETPLFITMKDPTTPSTRMAKRADPSDPTNITAIIPPPMLNTDGTAAPANLLPFPSAQPLRLFNRGTDNEYYGFYTYFDRSIFLKQINGTNRGGNPADTDGGSTRDAANLRCTYSETRFLVQIWTRSKTSKPLLQNSGSNSSEVFKRPGTFPYPVTFTIDRHGGNPAKKNLYCYEMEGDGTIKDDASKRKFQFEDRAFGGNLVNGTQGRPNVSGPIDGGSGGCRCQWQNWLS